jgi:hypothetical protein
MRSDRMCLAVRDEEEMPSLAGFVNAVNLVIGADTLWRKRAVEQLLATG